jgi:insulysin
MNLMKEPFFSTLRTQQQTGYVVASADQDLENHLFNFFIVESSSHDGRELIARYELFIEQFLKDLQSSHYPQERFTRVKDSLIEALLQMPPNPEEMGALLKTLAFTYRDFHRIENRIISLQKLSFDEFKLLAQEMLGPSNRRRLGLIVEGEMDPEMLIRYTPLPSLHP